MKSTFLFLSLFLFSIASFAQEYETPENQEAPSGMDNERLDFILGVISDEVQGQKGQWQFVIDSIAFMLFTDEYHNRMRIISPIEKMEDVSDEQLRKCMDANFHTALDSKYASSEGVLWSVFIHPLRELTDDQVIDAISQVYSSARTFGTLYTSGALSFPNNQQREQEFEKREKELKKKKLKRS